MCGCEDLERLLLDINLNFCAFQPAVEAFFLVHATETSQSRKNASTSEPESRESQLAHINEQPPVSPGQPAGQGQFPVSLKSKATLISLLLFKRFEF